MAYLKRNPQRLSTTALGVILNVIYTVSTFTPRAQDEKRPLLVTSHPSSKRTFFIQHLNIWRRGTWQDCPENMKQNTKWNKTDIWKEEKQTWPLNLMRNRPDDFSAHLTWWIRMFLQSEKHLQHFRPPNMVTWLTQHKQQQSNIYLVDRRGSANKRKASC